jgi:PAS domain S-box-containing protein
MPAPAKLRKPGLPLADATPRELSAFCQAVMETTHAGVCVTDRDMRFVLVNPSACQTYGRSRGSLIGQPFTVVLEPSQRRMAEEAHRAFLDGRGDMSGEWTVRRPDGSQAIGLTSVSRLVTAGGQVLRVSTFIDVTAMRQTERALAEAAQARDRFVASMNDEFRTPLSAILGLSDLLLAQAAQGDLQPSQAAMVRDIRGAGQHLMEMAQETLDHARLAGGLYTPVRRWTGWKSLVEAAVRLAGFAIREAGVTLRLEGGPDLPLQIDPPAMRQALINILRVAAQRLVAGSEMVLRWRIDGAMLVIECRGSPAPLVVPLHRRAAEPRLPTRFGLDIAMGILKAHDGTLIVTDEEGHHMEACLPLPSELPA